MAKKGTRFSSYSDEFKAAAVKMYVEDHLSYQTIVDVLGLKSRTQVADWVKRSQANLAVSDQRKIIRGTPGRKKISFSNLEEELAYVKAERDYLKKLYQNRFEEVSPRK